MPDSIKPSMFNAFSTTALRQPSIPINTSDVSAGGGAQPSVSPLANNWMRDSFVGSRELKSNDVRLGGCFPMTDKVSQAGGMENNAELLKDAIKEFMALLEKLMSGMEGEMPQGMEGASPEGEDMALEGDATSVEGMDATGAPIQMGGGTESPSSVEGSGPQSEKGEKAAKSSGSTAKAKKAQSAQDGGEGKIKSSDVMKRAKTEGEEINRTGGYQFDGKNDCYGFVRRVWDPILKAQGKSGLPVNDLGSKNWERIDWDKLKPGAVLSTHQGHAWGKKWHGALYAGKMNGKHYIYDNSRSNDAKLRPLPSPDYFKYVHTPTLKMLNGKA
ncbi:hypothetical protein F0U60_47050 [Archangium minus]|uniref:NlpC/P60 domain-containing protein n=1 Tax=Archangium minus TaxID=83450 RepID=A0ABY9X621_9BACT|nr:hypothetical protein F0U60_47050 [Archangium minus]